MAQVARSEHSILANPQRPKFIMQHPVLSYYGLAFAISWGGIILVAGGPGGIPAVPEQVRGLMPLMLLALFAGPSVAGLLMTALVNGRTGLRELRSRLFHWRVGALWYVAALLPAPLLVSALLLGLSLINPAFLPGILTTDDKAFLLIAGLAGALIGGGFMEELGWTGFVIPRLQRQHSVLATGLIVGLLWGAWHVLVVYWGGGNLTGGHTLSTWLPGMLFFYFGALPAYRILLVWVYDHTESLLLAMLMHASLSASTLILQPLTTGVPFMIWNFALAALLWIAVAVTMVASRGQQSQAPRLLTGEPDLVALRAA
jgi:uncharacterized protein